MKGIYVIMPVWGQRFVARWLRYSLPSLLSPGNLPALATMFPVKFVLYTTEADLPVLLGSPLLKAARALMGLRTVQLAPTAEALNTAHKYQVMTFCHNHGLDLGWQDDYGLIFGVADAVFADGGMAELGHLVAGGKRAVLTQGIHIIEDLFDPLLDALQIKRSETALTIPPRILARMTVNGLHPISRSLVWGSVPFSWHPSILYWRLGEHGFIMRSWHLNPMFLYPDRKARISTTLDGDLIGQAVSNLEDDCVIVDDSDRFFCVGVSDRGTRDFIPGGPTQADPKAVAGWLPQNTRPFTRDMIQQKIWLHDGINRDDWRHVEAESDRVVAEILDYYARLPTGG
jgi:hypothetical protein